jgi:hypothetical protein
MSYGQPKKDPNSTTGYYIPENLEDAIIEIDRMMGKTGHLETLNRPEEDMCMLHHGTGMWLRNNWGLWQGSRLANYFNSIGITHADDMSGIILDSYWRTLHDEPLDIEGQVKFYQDFWAKSLQESE